MAERKERVLILCSPRRDSQQQQAQKAHRFAYAAYGGVRESYSGSLVFSPWAANPSDPAARLATRETQGTKLSVSLTAALE